MTAVVIVQPLVHLVELLLDAFELVLVALLAITDVQEVGAHLPAHLG